MNTWTYATTFLVCKYLSGSMDMFVYMVKRHCRRNAMYLGEMPSSSQVGDMASDE